MDFLTYFFIVLLSIASFVILIFSIISGKPFKTLLFNALLGLGVLGIIDLLARFTGVFIPINHYTVFGSAVFGMPAVCSFLIFNFIFL